MSSSITHDTIAALAYEIYVNEGSPCGMHEQHWRKAVRRLSDSPVAPAELVQAKVTEPLTVNQPAGDLFHPLA